MLVGGEVREGVGRRCHPTVVPCVNGSEQLLVLLHEVGQLDHQPAAVSSRESLPLWIPKGFIRRLNGLVDVFGRAGLHRGDI